MDDDYVLDSIMSRCFSLWEWLVSASSLCDSTMGATPIDSFGDFPSRYVHIQIMESLYFYPCKF